MPMTIELDGLLEAGTIAQIGTARREQGISIEQAVDWHLAHTGATIFDPCKLPSADALHDLRSSTVATEFKASLSCLSARHQPSEAVHTLDDLIAWKGAHLATIPYGQIN